MINKIKKGKTAVINRGFDRNDNAIPTSVVGMMSRLINLSERCEMKEFKTTKRHKINLKKEKKWARSQPSSSINHKRRSYLNLSMAGWANGSVAKNFLLFYLKIKRYKEQKVFPHQVGEAGSIPAPATMKR